MADRISCSCVTCPKCGAWIVVQGGHIIERTGTNTRFQTTCPVPECSQQFAFDSEEAQTFDIALSLFERRYFYRSELLPSH